MLNISSGANSLNLDQRNRSCFLEKIGSSIGFPVWEAFRSFSVWSSSSRLMKSR